MKKSIILLILAAALVTACNESKTSNENQTQEPSASEINRQAIINGHVDISKKHKSIVSLYYRSSPDAAGESVCTGTLIHPKWVLTAAHCVAEDVGNGMDYADYVDNLAIGIGNSEKELKDHTYDIDMIYYHEDYGEKLVNEFSTIANDIALIKLAKGVSEMDAYPIAPLTPELGINREMIESEGVSAEYVGYGIDEKDGKGVKLKIDGKFTSYCGAADTDNLNGCYYGTVMINGCHPDKLTCKDPQNTGICSTEYLCLTNQPFDVLIPHGGIYTESTTGGTCQGDSGGPALVTIDGIEYVAGITSYGDAVCAKATIHTAVQDFYESFILKYAPEVETYHTGRMNAWKSEIASQKCGKAHKTYCAATSLYNSCYFTSTDGDFVCGYACNKEGDTTQYCQRDKDGVYRTYRNICTKTDDKLIPVTDESFTHVCDAGCNADNSDCMDIDMQATLDAEKASGICGPAHIERCLALSDQLDACYFANDETVCTNSCENENDSYSVCTSNDEGIPLTVFYKCTRVGEKLIYVEDHLRTCAESCNADATDCEETASQAELDAEKTCGPRHIDICRKYFVDENLACYFDPTESIICTNTCEKPESNRKCIRIDDSYFAYTDSCESDNGTLIRKTSDIIQCDYGCNKSGTDCMPAQTMTPYTETFDGIGSDKAKYRSDTFISPNTPAKWVYTAKTNLGKNAIDGEGLVVNDNQLTGYLHTNISTLSLDARYIGSSNEHAVMTIFVNDINYGSIEVIDPSVENFIVSDINITEDAILVIKIEGGPVVIDNIAWITY